MNYRILLPLLFISALIFSSCNSALSITKRKYMKGYYVHHSTAANAASAAKSQTKKRKHPSEKTSPAPEQPVPETAKTLQDDAPNTMSDRISLPQTAKKNVSLIELSPSTFITNPVQSFKQLKKHIEASPSAGEALSMLWLLAVILLVVYLAGLLLDNFGAGWIIHLLLVAALVVFLLWLLRII